MSFIYNDQDCYIFAGRHMREVQAKWDRLSMSDLAQIKTKAQLVAHVQEQYGLSHQVAVQDVEIWSLDRRS
jgi:predicted 3-demethylubiquinone-9 3-methyltransferase (glyoxalase superfamily)